MNLNRGKNRLSVEFRDGSESFVFRTSINCLNADEAGHCTDSARTKLGCHPERSEGGRVQKLV